MGQGFGLKVWVDQQGVLGWRMYVGKWKLKYQWNRGRLKRYLKTLSYSRNHLPYCRPVGVMALLYLKSNWETTETGTDGENASAGTLEKTWTELELELNKTMKLRWGSPCCRLHTIHTKHKAIIMGLVFISMSPFSHGEREQKHSRWNWERGCESWSAPLHSCCIWGETCIGHHEWQKGTCTPGSWLPAADREDPNWRGCD